MKKLGKFIFGTLSVATLAAYYLYKNVINKDSSDDFDDFEDDFEDFETEDDFDSNDTREYVSINITSDDEPEIELPVGEELVAEDMEARMEEE